MESGGLFNLHYTKQFKGIALFQHGSNEAIELEDAWPRLGEPELERAHQAYIEPVDAAERRTVYWAIGGIVGLGAGVGAAAAIGDSNKGAATALGVTGLALGVIGVIGALVSQPSGPAQLEANARRRMFIEGDDPPGAVRRGVDRNNSRARTRCASGGN